MVLNKHFLKGELVDITKFTTNLVLAVKDSCTAVYQAVHFGQSGALFKFDTLCVESIEENASKRASKNLFGIFLETLGLKQLDDDQDEDNNPEDNLPSVTNIKETKPIDNWAEALCQAKGVFQVPKLWIIISTKDQTHCSVCTAIIAY
eukprot:scaffold3143_cov164-Amphora_coffeaeformis.AAC.3